MRWIGGSAVEGVVMSELNVHFIVVAVWIESTCLKETRLGQSGSPAKNGEQRTREEDRVLVIAFLFLARSVSIMGNIL